MCDDCDDLDRDTIRDDYYITLADINHDLDTL